MREHMKNSLKDLHDAMMAQIERLNKEGISNKKLEKEINRSRAISSVAKTMVSNADLMLRAQKQGDDYIDANRELPTIFVEKKQKALTND